MTPEFLYEKDIKDLSVDLQERLETCLPDETGYVANTFVCPHCGSMCVSHWDTDEFGNFIYRCFDCESIINEEELDLV